jgi:hypothetical protein
MSHYARKIEIERRAVARNRHVANIKLTVCAALLIMVFAVGIGHVIDTKFAARCESGAIVSDLCSEVEK